mmetsp:Transcript_133/g.394  ORF Transcript_133/g.394 Transcript_133/m.394 type:complete len:114 (-) Transcript_133:126-467(-)
MKPSEHLQVPRRLCLVLASMLVLLNLRSVHSEVTAETCSPIDVGSTSELDAAANGGPDAESVPGETAPAETSFIATYKAPIVAICLNVVGTIVVWLHKSERVKLAMMLHLAVA